MNVAAPRILSTGIETAFAAPSNPPVSKSSSSVPLPAAQAAWFPLLLGEIADSETGSQLAFPRGAAPESKATSALAAGASKKASAGKNRIARGATTSDPGQYPAASDPANVRTPSGWLAQDGTLSPRMALSGPFSETSGAGGDGGAGEASAALAGADGEVASSQAHATRAAANLGAVPADHASPSAGVEQPSKLTTERAGGSAVGAAELAAGASALEAQALDQPGAQAVEGVRAARREAGAVSNHPPSSSAIAAMSPDDRASEVASTQNRATQAASTVATGEADAAASLFARLAALSAGQTGEPELAANDSSGANLAVGAGSSGDGLAKQGALAFQAWLVPAPASDPQPAGQAVEAAGGASGDRPGSRSAGDADSAPASAIQPSRAGSTPQVGPVAHDLAMAAPVPSNPSAGAAAPQSAISRRDAAPAPPDLSAWTGAGSAPKPAAGGAAREIQLEVRDSDARVNLRLVERAGSVQVDVRTPDSHLASSLRDDLPALTARLEQTGLHAETWHDAPAAAAARTRVAEPASSAGFQSSQNQSRREGGGRDPRDGQPQEKRQPQNQPDSKEFSWLYTSLE